MRKSDLDIVDIAASAGTIGSDEAAKKAGPATGIDQGITTPETRSVYIPSTGKERGTSNHPRTGNPRRYTYFARHWDELRDISPL